MTCPFCNSDWIVLIDNFVDCERYRCAKCGEMFIVRVVL